MQNLMWICCCTCSVILNVMATQYTGSLNSVYRCHWLVQWSRHCSCMCIPVHCPLLPGYIDFTQTFLVVLTMAGLPPDSLEKVDKEKLRLWDLQFFSRLLFISNRIKSREKSTMAFPSTNYCLASATASSQPSLLLPSSPHSFLWDYCEANSRHCTLLGISKR